MKRTTIIALSLAVFLVFGVSMQASAKEVLRYSGSNQIYHACDREMISAFSEASGVVVDVNNDTLQNHVATSRFERARYLATAVGV